MPAHSSQGCLKLTFIFLSVPRGSFSSSSLLPQHAVVVLWLPNIHTCSVWHLRIRRWVGCSWFSQEAHSQTGKVNIQIAQKFLFLILFFTLKFVETITTLQYSLPLPSETLPYVLPCSPLITALTEEAKVCVRHRSWGAEVEAWEVDPWAWGVSLHA